MTLLRKGALQAAPMAARKRSLVRRSATLAALFGSAAALLFSSAAPSSASTYSSASVDKTCIAYVSGCIAVYGDVTTTAFATHTGNKLAVAWEWTASTPLVVKFDFATFTFVVFDCGTGKAIWNKIYNYANGTTLHDVDSSTNLNVTSGHKYMVQVSGAGAYVRHNPNGTRSEGHFTYGPSGGYIDHGACA